MNKQQLEEIKNAQIRYSFQNNDAGITYEIIKHEPSRLGRLLDMRVSYKAGSPRPPMHMHPHQQEEFTILEGTLTVFTAGIKRKLSTGDRITIPKGQAHAMWNESESQVLINWKVAPALDTEKMLRKASELANGREQSKPRFWDQIELLRTYKNVFVLTGMLGFIVGSVIRFIYPLRRFFRSKG